MSPSFAASMCRGRQMPERHDSGHPGQERPVHDSREVSIAKGSEKSRAPERHQPGSVDPMPDGAIDWSLATFDGVRAIQHREFAALSFREKLIRLEQMAEIAARLRAGGQ